MSAIKTARRERQAQNIEPEYVTDEATGNTILNPKLHPEEEEKEQVINQDGN